MRFMWPKWQKGSTFAKLWSFSLQIWSANVHEEIERWSISHKNGDTYPKYNAKKTMQCTWFCKVLITSTHTHLVHNASQCKHLHRVKFNTPVKWFCFCFCNAFALRYNEKGILISPQIKSKFESIHVLSWFTSPGKEMH